MKTPKEQARDYVWHNYGEGDFNEHNWDRSAEEIWLAGYKAAKQWISVKDYYPIPTNDNCDCKLVAVKAANGYVFDVADTAHGCLWADKLGENVEHETHEVTHWMELPAPPKEEK